MHFDRIQTFAESIVSTMSAAQLASFSRVAFVASFSHPDYVTYGDCVDLADCVEAAVARQVSSASKPKINWAEAA